VEITGGRLRAEGGLDMRVSLSRPQTIPTITPQN
jgi:hypothetical protein